MKKTPIKLGQIWRQKGTSYQIYIGGKKGDLWLAKVLTDKPGVYNGSHRMNPRTIWHNFELL